MDDMNTLMENPKDTARHQTYGERQFDALDDTITEDMSMSMQRSGEPTYKSANKQQLSSKLLSPRSNASLPNQMTMTNSLHK